MRGDRDTSLLAEPSGGNSLVLKTRIGTVVFGVPCGDGPCEPALEAAPEPTPGPGLWLTRASTIGCASGEGAAQKGLNTTTHSDGPTAKMHAVPAQMWHGVSPHRVRWARSKAPMACARHSTRPAVVTAHTLNVRNHTLSAHTT